jgi:hypothetical protein
MSKLILTLLAMGVTGCTFNSILKAQQVVDREMHQGHHPESILEIPGVYCCWQAD